MVRYINVRHIMRKPRGKTHFNQNRIISPISLNQQLTYFFFLQTQTTLNLTLDWQGSKMSTFKKILKPKH